MGGSHGPNKWNCVHCGESWRFYILRETVLRIHFIWCGTGSWIRLAKNGPMRSLTNNLHTFVFSSLGWTFETWLRNPDSAKMLWNPMNSDPAPSHLRELFKRFRHVEEKRTNWFALKLNSFMKLVYFINLPHFIVNLIMNVL